MEMAPDYIARKNGKTEFEYTHPMMEEILSETYGVALYQEQVIRISNVLAGFSMSEGDGLRKAMGKKLPEEMAKHRGRFIEGCGANGIDEGIARQVFDMIERFAGYGFNKAHSAAYAVIAAQTAYMKANYPVEFMAAVLSTEIGNSDKIVSNISECRRSGIAVLPPSDQRDPHRRRRKLRPRQHRQRIQMQPSGQVQPTHRLKWIHGQIRHEHPN